MLKTTYFLKQPQKSKYEMEMFHKKYIGCIIWTMKWIFFLNLASDLNLFYSFNYHTNYLFRSWILKFLL